MKYLLLLLFFCSMSVHAHFYDWTKEQKNWYLASNVAIIADWTTTRNMTRRYDEGFRERNFILGDRPSTQRLDLYFTGYLIGHYLLADYLQGERRLGYLKIVTFVELAAVGNNLSVGLRLRF